MSARTCRPLALASALLLAACGGGDDRPPPAPKPEAMEHPEAKFLVDYGGASFRVNVRYVPLIDESVIAVREGRGEAAAEGWAKLRLEAAEDFSRVSNFADDRYRDFI
ncbi:MAG: hypothetical protein AAFR44_04140, partial [Pseudomonadota bacterium]